MYRFLKNLMVLVTGAPRVAKAAGRNETMRLIIDRRSCRSFTQERLSDDALHTILEAGRFSPSTVNLQTWSFITFTPEQWRAVFDRPLPFRGAFAVVVCADTFRLKEFFPDFQETPCINLSFAVFNAGLAAMNMTIAAEALGIRSIMLSETGRTGLLDIGFLKEKLRLPAGVLPLTTLVLGKGGSKLPGIPPRQTRDATVMRTCYDPTAGSRLKDWFDQMFIGFKITHPLSSFDKQIAFYRKKMLEAEKEVKKEFFPAAGGDKKAG
jgi:nitroreductase